MSLSNFIKWLLYRAFLLRVARALRLLGALEVLYYRLFRPRGGKIHITIKGIKAQFYVNKPDELRLLEVIGCSRGGEHRLLEMLIQACQPGNVVYDIGASIGTHTIFLAKRVGEYGRVIAFEPESQSFEQLQSNLWLNLLNNVAVFHIALGEREG